MVSLQLERRPGAVVGTVLLRLSWFNLSLIGLSGLLATVVFVYLLAENLAIFAR